ncbi:putative ABC transport system permease protein [Chitinophaga jiangningensis]|uniref:Putative ABC transport system permease protein n=1 Tax=Chitinophaga jiangningensis TaxID=1419482 RepID=A0A1M6W8D5_9BACT|nr:ABC transporter permease [Chitinophaga jiangningensis]SHK89957.1 putative ABC transport system permease protein [Chitinophaga jiangningensis]
MQSRDIFSLAYRSVTGNKLRTGLTVAIIALGITVLVGILTAIDSMKNSIYSSFAMMGANSFSIRNRDIQVRMGDDSEKASKGNKNQKKVKKSNSNKVISYQDAVRFKERYHFPAEVSINFRASGIATVYKDDKKTNPNVTVIGGDENYLKVASYEVAEGRNFNTLDVESGRNVAILGKDVAEKLFGKKLKNVVNNTVRVGDVRYRVIGVLASKGSSAMMSQDNVVLTTVNNTRRIFNRPNASYQIGIAVKDISQMEPAQGEAIGLFRIIRGLAVNEADNFVISKSDSIAEMLFSSLSKVNLFAVAIAFITLFGSAIGLMNIMLVSVAERTREIGVTKALGATSKVVRQQFLYEAIIISVMGGVIGVLVGMLFGNVVSLLLGSPFIIPWLWIFIGVSLCAIVGLISGIYPAYKASKLDPIIALRYE